MELIDIIENQTINLSYIGLLENSIEDEVLIKDLQDMLEITSNNK